MIHSFDFSEKYLAAIIATLLARSLAKDESKRFHPTITVKITTILAKVFTRTMHKLDWFRSCPEHTTNATVYPKLFLLLLLLKIHRDPSIFHHALNYFQIFKLFKFIITIPRIFKFFEISDITFEKSKGSSLYKRYIVSIFSCKFPLVYLVRLKGMTK